VSTLYTPADLLVGPIIQGLHNIVQNQISGVTVLYTTEPDGPFEDNSVFIPEPTWKVQGDTNGKLYLTVEFGLRHIVQRSLLEDSFPAVRAYLHPYLMALATWANQDLGGTAITVNILKGGIGQWVHAGVPHVALLLNIEVLTEFNIPVN
jgi:hypothetical protein